MIKGAYSMSYYSKTIYPYIERIIRDHNYDSGKWLYNLSFDDLEMDEQQELAKMMMQHHGQNLISIYDNDDYELIAQSLINMLGNPDMDNRLCFSEIVMDRVIKFYQPEIQGIIDDVIGWVEQEDREEFGFRRSSHKDNGETLWIKE